MLVAFYRSIQYLSIDIVIGAIILLRFFSSWFSITPSYYIQFLLATSVWMIYTVDHLRDAGNAQQSKRGRYQFHLKHEKTLKVALVLVFLASIYSIFHISSIILIAGSFLALLSVVYLAVQGLLSKWGLKELYVSIIYTSGILLVPFLLTEEVDFVVFFQLFLLTFLNLITFSWFERKEDFDDGFVSIASVLGNKNLKKVILSVAITGIILTLFPSFSYLSIYFIVAFILFTILILANTWAQKNLRYRSLGDGIFILPIIFEWL